jgi:hypothetical protein
MNNEHSWIFWWIFMSIFHEFKIHELFHELWVIHELWIFMIFVFVNIDEYVSWI